MSATGTVTLVGAGPGNRELLTLKGATVLQTADAVVFDRLVSPDILSLIPESALQISVGKENHCHPVPQQEINALLVRLAKDGKHVVRLKGGDCFLFGRGGEECEYLLENGIPFEVVPGVTSALAAPAYAGIPVTHRNHSSSVHLITAHAQAGKKLEIDFKSLVCLKGTLVFLMGLAALESIVNGLLSAGLPCDTPAAVIENGTRGNQRKVIAGVKHLSEETRASGISSPALIVVGHVCALSSHLDWFTSLPLHGKTILIPRSNERKGTLSNQLRDAGANVIECPFIRTVELENADRLSCALNEKWDWVVLTSPTGVHAMVHMLQRTGRDLRALWDCRFAVVGPGTAQQLHQYGIQADLIPESYDGVHLAKALVQILSPGERVLLLRAEQSTAALPKQLEAANISFIEIPTYRTVYVSDSPALRSLFASNSVDAVMFTSTSTVEGFVQVAGAKDFPSFLAVCIGKQTASAAQKYGMRIKIAKEATIDAMIAVLMEE